MTKKSLEKSMLFLIDKVIQNFPRKSMLFLFQDCFKKQKIQKSEKACFIKQPKKVKKVEKVFSGKSMLLSFKQKRKFSKNFFEKKHAFFIWKFVQDHQKHNFEKVFF